MEKKREERCDLRTSTQHGSLQHGNSVNNHPVTLFPQLRYLSVVTGNSPKNVNQKLK